MPDLKNSIASGYKIAQDANLTHLSKKIGCQLSKSPAILQKNLALATLIKSKILISRQKAIVSLRKDLSEKRERWDGWFKRLAEIEKDILPFFEATGAKEKDSLEKDAIAQLSFQDEICKPLNNVPWMILCIAMFKIWVVPVMTLATPIIAWILPYIILRFVYALPITQQDYVRILQGIWAGDMNIQNLQMGHVLPPGPNLMTPRSVFQFIIFAISFSQSMIQPIQNAMHLYKTDAILYGVGQKLLEVKQIVENLRAETAEMDTSIQPVSLLEDLDPSDPRRSFLLVVEQRDRIHMTLANVAQLEVLWRIAAADALLKQVVFKRDMLSLRGLTDISLENGVPSTVELAGTTQRHAIITGPNGGGKSSFLRSVLQSVILGHTFGFAPAELAIMPRFFWIASGLQLRDTPGEYSMFETEVKFAADCIRSSRPNAPGLVLFDELFHSTNPPDGARSAQVFLKQLWAPESNIYSVVSTHVFPLVESRPDTVQAICCPATKGADGSITYSYKAEPGICRVSSVHKVWKKYGLTK